MEPSFVRVLVVEDFFAFRRFICSTLRQRPHLQIVFEASDGLEAVQQARQLQPDLILLDIGLPSLNGIEAARQIRKLSSQSKIIFLSQESSPDIVQEALNSGAEAYVTKTRAASELLLAVDTVLEGRRFVGTGISGNGFLDGLHRRENVAQHSNSSVSPCRSDAATESIL